MNKSFGVDPITIFVVGLIKSCVESSHSLSKNTGWLVTCTLFTAPDGDLQYTPVFVAVVTCLVLENMAAGSLYTVLHENRKPKTARYPLQPHHYGQIVMDIIRGMGFLEKLRVRLP